ncbi:MAG: NrfD/PsrC family molybdoenzyme membrane anchor subunit [Terriglobia bacterium]
MPKRFSLLDLVLLALLLAGLGAFVYGATGSDSQRAWQIYLVNLLFWSGMAQAGVVFAAILHLTNARWAGPVKQLALGGAACLPVSFLLFLGLYFGREQLFPWLHHPIPEKAAWLNLPSLFARDGLALLVLYGSSLLFFYYSMRADRSEDERRRNHRRLSVLAPLLVFLYAIVFSLLGFDLVMSLSPHWYSTLFGGYFFVGNLYLGLAGLAIVAAVVRRYFHLEAHLGPPRFHDLGKLVFAFCLLWTYLFWSQYLVIWYGDVPEETGFIFTRVKQELWSPLAWSVLGLCFLVPFVLLLSREVKRRPGSLSAVCGVVLVGMWLERYILVVPSLWKENWVPFGALEVFITLGFFSVTALCYRFFLRTFPLVRPEDSDSVHST